MSNILNLEPKKEIFIPEKCKNCTYYVENKPDVVGIKIQTPFSYILVKGCVSEIPCEEKNIQLLFFGIGIDDYEIRGILWELLTGDRELKDKEKLVDLLEKFSGYKLNKACNTKIELPEVVKYTVKAIIDSEFPCTFTYPIVGYGNPDIIIDPVTNDFEVISRPLPATPEEMFSITVHYECGRIPEKYGFSGNIVFIIKNSSKAELYDHIYIFSDKDRLTLLDKINKYLVIALELLTKGKQRDIEKLVEVFRILAKYIKLYVIENKKRGESPPSISLHTVCMKSHL